MYKKNCCTCRVVFLLIRKKSVLHVQSCFFANQIYCCCFYPSRCFQLVISITRFYIFFKESMAKSIYQSKGGVNQHCNSWQYVPKTVFNRIGILSLPGALFISRHGHDQLGHLLKGEQVTNVRPRGGGVIWEIAVGQPM